MGKLLPFLQCTCNLADSHVNTTLFRQALESASLSLTAVATMVPGYQATVLTMVTASDAVRIFPVPPMVYLVNARLPVRGEPRIRKSLLA
jgi:hypothetical protein